jgi:8-oxo-dGTP pyrophosphatase MutT (NUDIX family)
LSAFTWPPESSPSASPGLSETDAQIPAAVLVPLFLCGERGEPHVVLTKRRADLRRHAGEISFPGGRRDDEDADLAATALREAEEEIGLPRAQVSLLGALPQTSTFATNYVIHPFVGTIPAGLAWSPSAREVDSVLELPLDALRAARTQTDIKRRGITFTTDAYILDNQVIWGATARILEHLLERLSSATADGHLTLKP